MRTNQPQSDLNKSIYTDQPCNICNGECAWWVGDQRHVCDTCGGSGSLLTELGSAIWELASRAAVAVKR